MSKEAMNLALEALKTLVERFDYEQFTSVCELDDAKDAITTLEEALAKQEQGEPVAKCCSAGIAHDCHAGDGCRIIERIKTVNTTPQQRTWVGLTEEDRLDAKIKGCSLDDYIEIVEAKLKEKNT